MRDFGTLAHATIDLPATDDGRRSFREAFEDTAFKFGSYATSTQAISAADVVVNATPLGMGAGDPAPFDPALFPAWPDGVRRRVRSRGHCVRGRRAR